MKNRKSIILIVIITLLTAYVIFSKSKSSEEIKSLTAEIEIKSDSLRLLNNKYRDLELRYDTIYNSFEITSNRFKDFRTQLDSVLGLNISSLRRLNRSLDNINGRYKEMAKLDSINDDNFRFE